MDMVAGLLDGPRARGAFMLRTVMDPPWSMRIQDEAPLTIVVVTKGSAWVTITGHDPVELRAGSVAIVRCSEPYDIADSPATEPFVVIHPGQRCTTLQGEDLSVTMELGVRSWGNASDGATVMLTGTYEWHRAVSHDLVDQLPKLVVLHGDEWSSPLVGLLADEIVRDDPGQQVVLDRLLDLLLVDLLRTWMSRQGVDAPPWYRATRDPIVGKALRLIHDTPESPWTIESLARAVGVSRANLAKRFTELTGEPPIRHLTRWRLSLASDLLREPGSSIGAVAAKVGYGSPFALSTAFKREYGLSPMQHRAAG